MDQAFSGGRRLSSVVVARRRRPVFKGVYMTIDEVLQRLDAIVGQFPESMTVALTGSQGIMRADNANSDIRELLNDMKREKMLGQLGER